MKRKKKAVPVKVYGLKDDGGNIYFGERLFLSKKSAQYYHKNIGDTFSIARFEIKETK